MGCESTRRQNVWSLVTAFLILAFTSVSSGLDISYCSPVLNAGSYNGVYDEFMSNGFCQQRCLGSYVFAVLQGYYCWCSNYIPGDQVNTYDCNEDCPGFQTEWCGSTTNDVYGYYYLGGTALGTSGGATIAPPSSSLSVSRTQRTPGFPSSPSPSTVSFSSSTVLSSATTTRTVLASSAPVVTVVPPQSPVQTSASPVEPSSTVTTSVSSATTSSTTQQQSTTFISSTSPTPTPTPADSSSTTTTPAPAINTVVTTILGSVKTILVTPTASAEPTFGQNPQNQGVSTGKVVGIVLGVAIGLGLIIGFVVFYWLRKKQQNSMRGLSPDGSSYREAPTDPNRIIPSRQVSQLSSSNLLARGGSVQTKSLNTSNTTRSADTTSSAVDRRSLGTDQRLNPHALYIHDEGRFSNLSLQDNHDYSRQLRVANPDP